MECRLIKLSKNQYAIVDIDDFDFANKFTWSYSSSGKSGYAKGTIGFKKKDYLHRFIMCFPEGKEIDHINRDTLDCRKSNLRLCDRSQNTFNHPKRKSNTSGHIGVWLEKKTGIWVAEIMVNYKKKHLGRFKRIEDAVLARKNAEAKTYPDFKRHE